MSTRSNLELEARQQEAENYRQWLSDNRVRIPTEEGRLIGTMLINGIYGHVLASTMEHFRSLPNINPHLGHRAVRSLCRLTYNASQNYAADLEGARPTDWLESPRFSNELAATQEAMTTGTIRLLPVEYAMTPEEGRQLAKNANLTLTVLGPKGTRELMDANYSLYFSANTMATAEDIIKADFEDIIESDTEAKMKHLQRTNFAIGQIIQSVAERSRHGISIVDHGSGSGGTLAAIVRGIEQAAQKGNLGNVSITGLESNPDFYKLLYHFALKATSRLWETEGVKLDTGVGNAFLERHSRDKDSIVSVNGLTVVHDDVLNSVRKLKEAALPSDQIEIVTANFVWHRLTTQSKRELIKNGRANIYLVADLASNSSNVNRRYFNFGNNGPLNCGNLLTPQLFEDEGFRVTTLSSQNAASLGVHPKLAEAIEHEGSNDGFLWIAYKGEQAKLNLGF